MGNENEPLYISLQEATEHCNYSQEYLSLRARQGKLKAAKFGRNWVIKKEWLNEYLGNIEEYNNNFKPHTLPLVSFSQNPVKKIVLPPENLPIERTPALQTFLGKKLGGPVLRFGFFIALVFVLVIVAFSSGMVSFQNVFETADSYVHSVSQISDSALASIFNNISNLMK